MSLQTGIRVLLADDHAMVREALARILEESGEITVEVQAGNGAAALAALEQTDVDVAVVDYSMPGLDAGQLIEKLLTRKATLRILVLTVHENIHYAVKVLECGAHGYMIKSAAVDELVQAIRAVHHGEMFISPKVASEVIQHLRQPRRNRVGLESLSQREFDVLRVLASGSSLQDCAKQLKISTSTASTYRARLLTKLNLKNTAQLIRFAMENDVVG